MIHRRVDAGGFDNRCNRGEDYRVSYLYKATPYIVRHKHLISNYISNKAQFKIIKSFIYYGKYEYINL
jgi:hypothetical protein